GECNSSPGPGKWGVILFYNERYKVISGSEPHTTNQQIKLIAVIEGFSALIDSFQQVEVFTDSQHVVNAFKKGWIYNWQLNNWIKSDGKIVKNKELWERLFNLIGDRQVKFNLRIKT